MKVRLTKVLVEMQGKMNGEYYGQTRNGKPILCKMPTRTKKVKREGPENTRFVEATKRAKEVLKNEELRGIAAQMMAEWNARFPEEWKPSRDAKVRLSEEHPYTSLYHFVIGQFIREMKEEAR